MGVYNTPGQPVAATREKVRGGNVSVVLLRKRMGKGSLRMGSL